MKKFEIYPSIISASYLDLRKNIQKMLDNGINTIHYDIMDGHFVPDVTMGSKILADIVHEFPTLKIDIHFMIDFTKLTIKDFFNRYLPMNVAQMNFHYEAITPKQLAEIVKLCKQNNIKASIAINPTTNWDGLKPYLDKIDNVLLMSVTPGAGGQKFIPASVDKIIALNNYRGQHKLNFTIGVDGGINDQTIGNVKALNLKYVVAGSYLFGQDDVAKRKELLLND